jgi:hypothetical protein
MARLAVGVVGAAVGFALGGPAGASIGWGLGAAAGGFLFPEQGPNVEGARLDDLRVMGSSFGVPIPIVYGAMRVPGQVIWARDLREIRTEEDLGGKGGPSATQTTYTYTGTFAVLLCEGPIAAITRIWANGQCLYDVRNPANTEALVASANWVAVTGMRVYLGTESQLPDPAIEATHGVGTTPAFRGRAYVVFENMPLAQFGNALPRQLDFEVTTSAATDTPRRAWTPPVALAGSYAAPWIDWFEGPVVAINNGSGTAELRSALDGAYLGNGVSRAGRPVVDPSGCLNAGVMQDGRGIYARSGLVGGAGPGCLKVGVSGPNVLAPLLAGRYVEGVKLPSHGRWAIVLHSSGTPRQPDAWIRVALDSGDLLGSGTVVAGISYFGVGRSSGSDINASYYAAAADDDNWEISWCAYTASNSQVALHVIGDDGVLRETVFMSSGAPRPVDFWGLDGAPPFSAVAVAARGGLLAAVAGGKLFVFRSFSASTSSAPTLQAVVSGICTRAGLSAGQIDVTALSGTVDGVAYTRGGSGRSLLDSLRAAYWFDAVESGNKIRFVPRGGAPVAALTVADLAADDDGAALVSEREHDEALPERVAVAYAARDSDYRVGSQMAVRAALRADALRTIELPLALSDQRAADSAAVALADAWMGRTARRLTLMPRWAALEPTDVIDLADATRSARLRIVRKSESLASGVKLEVVDEDAALYTPTATPGTVAATLNSPALGGPTRAEPLDIPALRDVDDNAGLYAALTGYLANWPGGALYRSGDGGATWVEAGAASAGAVVGAAETALPAFAGGNLVDEISTVTVAVGASATLASCTADQLLAGANAALVGDELIGFRDATLLAAGRYRLTGLLRGRRGTPQAGHAVGDRFVLLTTALLDVGGAVADIGRELRFSGVTVGARLTDSTPQTLLAFTAARLKPLAPVHLAATRLPGGDVSLRWVRCARLDTSWRDSVDVPLNEASESYDVEIWNAGNTAVLRTLTSTTASVTYTAANQTTDFGGAPSTINVRIYQRSATVGRGFAAVATLTP